MTPDFTLSKYAEFCQTINDLHCPIITVQEYLQTSQRDSALLVLRHDVDRFLSRAIRMAELEASYGIQATYYMRMTRPVFKPSKIRYLHELGHEVGYHYEVLSKAKGNSDKAIEQFGQELKLFRQVVPVATISMHGSPLSRWDNRELWREHDFGDYNLLGEAYISVDYTAAHYFTDTGRTWGETQYNLRDRVMSPSTPRSVRSTDDLLQFLKSRVNCPAIINAHPERWTVGWTEWVPSVLLDWILNRIKMVGIPGQQPI